SCPFVDPFRFSSPPSSPPCAYPFHEDVQRAVDDDPINGPRHDAYRRQQGIEYETLLCKQLLALGASFVTESDLRAHGAHKTPDVLLLVPLGLLVNGSYRLVRWIDSKAMFGDEVTNGSDVKRQAL
ncbi:hypothetical protein TrRE_jg5409, partial [Triparma retinervis]